MSETRRGGGFFTRGKSRMSQRPSGRSSACFTVIYFTFLPMRLLSHRESFFLTNYLAVTWTTKISFLSWHTFALLSFALCLQCADGSWCTLKFKPRIFYNYSAITICFSA